MLKIPLPPGYRLYRFPSVKKFHEFSQLTGAGSNCQYLERGVLAALYEDQTTNEMVIWGQRYGAVLCRKQPPVHPNHS